MRLASQSTPWSPSLLLLLSAFVFVSGNSVSAQGCEIVFTFQGIPEGPIDLFPGLDQPAPEFNSNGVQLSFGLYSSTPGGNAGMETASISNATSDIDSPTYLVLNGTNALFDLSNLDLPNGQVIHGISFQVQGDGSGAPINLGVNGSPPFVGPAPQVPNDLPGGISVLIEPGPQPSLATIVLTGNVTQLEIGGNIAIGDVCIIGEEESNGNAGCTDSAAANFEPNATVDDGSCKFTVEFVVNLDATDAPDGPIFLNGTFNDWCGNCAPLLGTGSVWSLAIDLPIGVHEYKFTTSNWGMQEQFDGGEPCTLTTETNGGTFVNRVLNVAGPMALPEVCWNSCGPCGGPCADADDDGLCDDQDPCVGAVDQCGVCNGNNDCLNDIAGCTYEAALNFDSLATEDDGSCVFDFANCDADADGDGVCDEDEILGCTAPCSCNYMSEATDDDGSCVDADALGICGGTCSGDADGDGECDDVDCCVGGFDECGVCNGPGGVYDCGCNMMAPGACDCEGSQLDALGICGGDCPSDIDSDGICDLEDPCIGFYDACGVCNGPGAIFTCGCFQIAPGDCDCEGNQLDALGICGGDCLSDTDGDGLCDADEVPGCMDGLACNYNPQATDDNGTCEYPESAFDCSGNCLLDTDDDGICDDLEIPGCMDSEACNYNAQATDNIGCYFPLPSFNCAGECLEDLDQDGVCDGIEVLGCTDNAACNFDPDATEEDESCFYSGDLVDCDGQCLFDVNEDGICDGQESLGCMDPDACNFDPDATDQGEDNFCYYPAPGYSCEGSGVLFGCMDIAACNYNPDATTSLSGEECLYAAPNYDCAGACLDFDGDGTCDLDEVDGCTYSNAENFNPLSTEDDGTCTFPDGSGPGEACPDINGDGVISVPDLLLLLGAFGSQSDC